MRNKNWVLLGFAFFAFIGCEKLTDLSSTPEYSQFVGKHYRTLQDLAAVKTERGLDLAQPGSLGIPSVEEMKSFPYERTGTIVIGVLPKGSVLKVTRVQKWKTFESTFVEFVVEVQGENIFKGEAITTSVFLDRVTKVDPQIRTEYVQEMEK